MWAGLYNVGNHNNIIRLLYLWGNTPVEMDFCPRLPRLPRLQEPPLGKDHEFLCFVSRLDSDTNFWVSVSCLCTQSCPIPKQGQVLE
jgi:hypothetical protein